jgi:hypothetical protein
MPQPSVSLVLAATHSFAYRDAGTEATSMEEADLQGHVKDPAAVGPWRERGVRQMNLSSSFGAGGASSLAVLCGDGERVYASALAYLAAGRALMGEAGQEEPYELIFALEFHTAECELLSADLVAAENRLAMLRPRAKTLQHVAAITSPCLRVRRMRRDRAPNIA